MKMQFENQFPPQRAQCLSPQKQNKPRKIHLQKIASLPLGVFDHDRKINKLTLPLAAKLAGIG